MNEIEKLKEINKEHQLLNGELSFKLSKLESENEELKKEIDVQNEQIIALETVLDEKEKVIAIDKAMYEDSISKGQVAKNYIKKSKIEDKIDELKAKLSHYDKYNRLNILEKVNIDLIDARIDTLQELLESEE